jgi:hypothetical protein
MVTDVPTDPPRLPGVTKTARVRALLVPTVCLVAGASLAACQGTAGQPGTAATGGTAAASGASPSGPNATGSAGREISVTVRGNQVTPSPSQVDLASGATLTIVVTSDHDDELHAHGFEVEKPLKAGVPTSITLRGGQPGVYEVETHHPPLRLLSVAVR